MNSSEINLRLNYYGQRETSIIFVSVPNITVAYHEFMYSFPSLEDHKIKLLTQYGSVTQKVLLLLEWTVIQMVVFGITNCKESWFLWASRKRPTSSLEVLGIPAPFLCRTLPVSWNYFNHYMKAEFSILSSVTTLQFDNELRFEKPNTVEILRYDFIYFPPNINEAGTGAK
jgi:hypothetical protein